ncbi:zinc finger SWIM domain-containing protein 7-like [Euwallacea similis]|uniref:zinc finger SWIM domain-containing protein 7-like n=1 Tax=Euwallacea similis TaxID=1736056 RepID=UPI00344D43A6
MAMQNNEIQLKKSFVPEKAFALFKDAEREFKENGSFSNEILENLHSYFGEPFSKAVEMVDKCRIIKYSPANPQRNIYEISSRTEQYSLFENINFCHCGFFKECVLSLKNNISCCHVLTVYLARIMGKCREETLSENIFEEYLNGRLDKFLEDRLE